MKVTIAQINTTPNDFEGNFQLIEQGIKQAVEDESRLVVFPELSICGYNVQDYVHSGVFIEKNIRYLDMVKQLTYINKNLYVVVGYIDKNYSGSGKPVHNMAAVLHNGIIVATYKKRLIPYTDVFFEERWFEPGDSPTIVDIDGHKCSITLCEDVWYNDKGYAGLNHKCTDPIKDANSLKCDVVINLSSSPYFKNKVNIRKNILKNILKNNAYIDTIIYVNQYGGQDDLVFDGNSMVLSKKSCNVFLGNQTIPYETNCQCMTTDIDNRAFVVHSKKFVSTEYEHLSMILLGLRDYVKKSKFNDVVLGSSGGIDSAVVIALASMALGPKHVHAIKMPSKWSSDHSVNDAVTLHNNFGVHDYTVKIDHEPWLQYINSSLLLGITECDVYNTVADENIQARQRAQVVMHFSNATGALALTTGNKTELAFGYFTSGGDSVGGFDPIGDLYKCEVYEIANLINEYYEKEMIPHNIINKAPSAELAPGQTDEASLLPYPILDRIVESYIEYHITTWDGFVNWIHKQQTIDKTEIVQWTRHDNQHHEINKKKYVDMIRRIDMMEFKRRQIPTCTKLSRKAFGTGRRMPIVKGL